MYSLSLVLLLVTAPPTAPVSLTVQGEPLAEVIDSRLAAVDKLVLRREGRLALPTDKRFRYRFHSRFLAEGVEPAFPAGLTGTIPLLESPDSRVRCAALMIIQKWLDETRRHDRRSLADSLSRADEQRVRLAILDNVANPKLKGNRHIIAELALQIFPSLVETALTETEESVLLQRLTTATNPRFRGQIVQLFLTVKPVRFPVALCAPMRQLLEGKSPERGRVVRLLQSLDAAPPELHGALSEVLKRDPHGWHAKPLALLLSRSGQRRPEMAPGLVRAFMQEVPSRGGMMGRGASSLYVPGGSNRWLVLQEKEQAKRALMTLPVDAPQVVPQLMTMLDAGDFEARATGLAAIRRFRSGALLAVPRMLAMNMRDDRPQGRIRIAILRIGLGPQVYSTVSDIVWASVWDLHRGEVAPLLISASSLLSTHLPKSLRIREASR